MTKRTALFTLAYLTALCLTFVSVCGAQPISEDIDIPNASKELRQILYERYELREQIEQAESEVRLLKEREKSFDKLIELQKQLDAVGSKIDKAKDEGADFKELEKVADQLDLKMEYCRMTGDIQEELAKYRVIITRFNRLNQGRLVKPVVELTEHLEEFRDIQSKLYQINLNGPESAEAVLEEKAEELEEEIELGRAYVELLSELREVFEQRDRDAVRELRAQLEALQKEMNREQLSAAPSDEDDGFNDPTRQPIPITEEGLASITEVGLEDGIVPLLKKHCYQCHGDDSESSDLNLQKMVTELPLVVNRDKWINVLEQAKNRVMPPEDEAQPSEEDRTKLVLALHNAIHNFDYSNIYDPGYEYARRLTHDEYDNTVRDLFGIDIRPTKTFPSDMTGSSSFDNTANTLFIQPLLMERYMGAAEDVVEAALPSEPQTAEQGRARELILGVTSPEANQTKSRDEVIKRFLRRAYRRPVTDDEVRRGVEQFNNAHTAGVSFHDAIKVVIRTTLISPKFLMKSEHQPDTNDAFHINDWELANRLSYFLWASMPDERLFELAASGELSKPDTLHAQVDWMIADEKSATLGSIFAAQWLGSRHLGTRIRMDPIDNPWCTESLMAAMRDETAMFFHTLVKENHPIPRLIDADFSFMNEELAKHYKIRGVRGAQMQRVSLADSERGGIFGHGSLLAVTSFPYRTSPVVRGRWVLSDVLGTPPPPPPPNVSQLPEEIERNKRLSFRQKLELHRKSPNCYACHSQMDPLGFSLEGYDYFGRTRKPGRKRNSRPDVRGRLPNGTEFAGLAGLKQVIVEQRLDDLGKQLAT